MAVKERSFWSTTAGVVTGITGFVTAIVGLLTVAVQLGWLSSNDDGGKPADSTATTAATAGGSSAPNPAAGGSNTTAATPQFTVTPTQLQFGQVALGSKDSIATVKNTGTSGFALKTPTVSGLNANLFTIAGNTCSGRLDAGRSCEVKVTFTPKGAGQFSATLVIQPDGGARATEVPMVGSGVL